MASFMTVEKWLEDSVKSADEISNQGSKSNFCPVEKRKFSSHKPQEENSVSNIEQSSKVDISCGLSDPNRILYTNHKYTKLHLKSIEVLTLEVRLLIFYNIICIPVADSLTPFSYSL